MSPSSTARARVDSVICRHWAKPLASTPASHFANPLKLLKNQFKTSRLLKSPRTPLATATNYSAKYRGVDGMGSIIKGRDTDLSRDLAVKVLLDKHKDRPEVIQRFMEEAQIGGQLQHPGIAPDLSSDNSKTSVRTSP